MALLLPIVCQVRNLMEPHSFWPGFNHRRKVVHLLWSVYGFGWLICGFSAGNHPVLPVYEASLLVIL